MNQGKFELAKQSLEQSLSADFVVRHTVVYHVLQAQIMMNSQQFDEALKARYRPSQLFPRFHVCLCLSCFQLNSSVALYCTVPIMHIIKTGRSFRKLSRHAGLKAQELCSFSSYICVSFLDTMDLMNI